MGNKVHQIQAKTSKKKEESSFHELAESGEEIIKAGPEWEGSNETRKYILKKQRGKYNKKNNKNVKKKQKIP